LLGPLDVAFDVIDILDGLDVDYVLGGSLASSTFGEPRATNDVDIAVSLTADDLTRLSLELHRLDYYMPDSAAADAVARRSSFNTIHPSGLKVAAAGKHPTASGETSSAFSEHKATSSTSSS
jgi:hypothetical protein